MDDQVKAREGKHIQCKKPKLHCEVGRLIGREGELTTLLEVQTKDERG